MKKICKKLLIIFTALVMSVSALSLSSCSYFAKGLDGDYSKGEVSSQGGWVVEKGDYIYFINGTFETLQDEEGNEIAREYENEYGNAVKASLMRIRKDDVNSSTYATASEKAEVVVPLLLVAQDYNAGIFIHGDYVYYATPSTAKNLQGETQSSYIDFKRTRLDGKETMRDYYFRSANAAAEYRFVEVDDVVYCLHMDGNNLYSYNTQEREDTLLAKETTSHVFHKNDKGDVYVYYTMGVIHDIDKNIPSTEAYNQVYRVRADATYTLDRREASYTVTDGTGAYEYTYDFDGDSMVEIAEKNEKDFSLGEIEGYPYVNLGQLVLDGIGSNDDKTQYNHSDSASFAPDGYKYTLISYANDGLYYRRQQVAASTSAGDSGWTYYLSDDNFTSNWDSIAANGSDVADIISLIPANVTANTLFYIKDDVHHYLYISGSSVVRVEVAEDGSVAEEVVVGRGAMASNLLYLDNESSQTYKYVYYTVSSGNGVGIGRTVYDSEEAGYEENEDQFYNAILGKEEYKPVTVLGINHPSDWYAPEIIGGKIFSLDTTAVGSIVLNLPQVTSIETSGADEVMNNKEIKEFNELLENFSEAIEEASGYSANLSDALHCYFYTEESERLSEVIEAYMEENDGKGEYSLFSAKEQEYFWAYVNKGQFKDGKTDIDFATLLKDEDGNYYNVRSYFYKTIGYLSEDETEELDEAWAVNYLQGTAKEEEGLETWQWVLIGVAIGVGALGVICGVTIPLVLHYRKKRMAERENAPKARKYKVDMDLEEDKDIDVYAVEETPVEESTQDAIEAIVEAPVEETAEDMVEVVEEPITSDAPVEEVVKEGENKDE